METLTSTHSQRLRYYFPHCRFSHLSVSKMVNKRKRGENSKRGCRKVWKREVAYVSTSVSLSSRSQWIFARDYRKPSEVGIKKSSVFTFPLLSPGLRAASPREEGGWLPRGGHRTSPCVRASTQAKMLNWVLSSLALSIPKCLGLNKKYVATVLDWIVSPKRYLLAISECDLIWNDLCRCSEGKDLKVRPSRVRVAFNTMRRALYETERGRRRHRGESHVTPEARNGDHAATSLGTSRTAKSHQKWGERSGWLLPQRLQKDATLPTSWFRTSGLQNHEKVNFCHLSNSVCGTVLWQP